MKAYTYAAQGNCDKVQDLVTQHLDPSVCEAMDGLTDLKVKSTTTDGDRAHVVLHARDEQGSGDIDVDLVKRGGNWLIDNS